MFVETYAEWTQDTHRHVEDGLVTYDGTPEDCPICAYPIQRQRVTWPANLTWLEDDGSTQPVDEA